MKGALSAVESKEATRMDLHANAALTWSGRRELARRVVDRGWMLTATASVPAMAIDAT